MPAWANWSGNVRATPARLAAPATEADVQALVRHAAREGLRVRPAGARHSFTPLCATDGIAVDLDALAGVESIDAAAHTATVLGGTKIAALGEPLRRAGLALHNQGDIDTQSITGATATGTHGTGPTLGNLSSAIDAVRIVTAEGELVHCSRAERLDLFEAARLSLGAVGIITAVTLRCIDAYNLHERIWFEGPDESLARLDERVAATRHYEFFWHPHRDLFEHKALHPTAASPDPLPDRRRERIDASHRVFPSIRAQRFNEMEYAVPAAEGPACFAEIRALVCERFRALEWPVEYRTLAADDLWLSPARGRPTVTISVHEGAEHPHDALFAACERVFLAHDGRPHWGKLHSLGADALRGRYDAWDRFCAVRAGADPDGRFLNEHLRDVFGV
jgi:FAD/FMN-containing dehydrogenase